MVHKMCDDTFPVNTDTDLEKQVTNPKIERVPMTLKILFKFSIDGHLNPEGSVSPCFLSSLTDAAPSTLFC